MLAIPLAPEAPTDPVTGLPVLPPPPPLGALTLAAIAAEEAYERTHDWRGRPVPEVRPCWRADGNHRWVKQTTWDGGIGLERSYSYIACCRCGDVAPEWLQDVLAGVVQ